MRSNGYPDVSFLNTDSETILTEMIAGFEEITGRKLYPASPERLFIAWCASVVVQLRVMINEAARMNVPRYATGEYLDSLSELFYGIERLPASSAVATFCFYISEAQNESVFIPKGTRISFDGEIVFETVEELEIPAGETKGEVIGECQISGIEGNGIAERQIKNVVDVYDYYLKVENVTETSGGADAENDEDYYERMRESMESYSTAGSINSYIYHVMSVSASVSDVNVTSPEPGVVDIRVLLESGKLPTETILEQIGERLNADDVRPLTDFVTISSPVEDLFEVDLTFYIDKNSPVSSGIIDKEVRKAVEEYLKWQQEKMGRDINPSNLIQRVMNAGLFSGVKPVVKRVEVRKPVFQTVESTHVARLDESALQILNGGTEDE